MRVTAYVPVARVGEFVDRAIYGVSNSRG